eukprot:6080860-Pleurochrysis_carterae.AAC.1
MSIPPSAGLYNAAALPPVNRTVPSLPLNSVSPAWRFQPARSSAAKSTAAGWIEVSRAVTLSLACTTARSAPESS